MQITAHSQVVIDEIALDLTDFLRQLIGAQNDDITQALVVLGVEKYLASIQELDFSQVVCDHTNNTPEIVDQSELNADLFFSIDSISYRGSFNVKPGNEVEYANVSYEFYVRVNRADLSSIAEIDEDTTQPEVQYDLIPKGLLNSLGGYHGN